MLIGNYELHVISDGQKSLNEFANIAGEIHSLVSFFHLREKEKTVDELSQGVQLLLEQGVPSNKIIINDRVDLAVVTGLKGVQLAYHSLKPKLVKRSFPQLLVGRSIHSVEEAKALEPQDVDFVIYGHVYASSSKQGLEPRGQQALSEITESTSVPVIAIGGINPGNISEVLKAGARGIAVMSGVLSSTDPLSRTMEYVQALQK